MIRISNFLLKESRRPNFKLFFSSVIIFLAYGQSRRSFAGFRTILCGLNHSESRFFLTYGAISFSYFLYSGVSIVPPQGLEGGGQILVFSLCSVFYLEFMIILDRSLLDEGT